ncbi:MAG: L-threonylcarbamoyladenylate synthase [Candidatus Peribacteraceae bacterium]|nr:L-threonylcarbamoyladenylate synthase [Candidatus Peribacteraceae bacterium]
MKVLPLSLQAIDQALEILAHGGSVAHATETCYGLACDLTNPKAVKRLFAIKARPADQPVSALFSSLEEAKKYVEWSDEAEELAQKHLPGPLTLILRLRRDAPKLFPTPYTPVLSGVEGLPPTPSLGLRLSSHPVARTLAERFGKPLSTTSANIHGKPSPYSLSDLRRQFHGEDGPDLIIDSGELPPTPPSTVIDLSQAGRKEVKRQGNLSINPERNDIGL